MAALGSAGGGALGGGGGLDIDREFEFGFFESIHRIS
jgi:hypothetical protein